MKNTKKFKYYSKRVRELTALGAYPETIASYIGVPIEILMELYSKELQEEDKACEIRALYAIYNAANNGEKGAMKG